MMATIPARVLTAACTVAGCGLALLSAGVATLRHGRPLHPKGRTYAATMHRDGADTGVPWLDRIGPADVMVRVSRAIGLPAQLPDIMGVAIRITWRDSDSRVDGADGKHRVADLLFASTGDTAVGRFVLQPRAKPASGPLTTLLPVRTKRGPLLLRLTFAESAAGGADTAPEVMRLSYAIGTGHWVPLGSLQFGAEIGHHEYDRHDPVEHQLPGQQQYRWVERLREPAYRSARRRGPLPSEEERP